MSFEDYGKAIVVACNVTIFVGALFVQPWIEDSRHKKEIEKAKTVPVTLKQEGIINKSWLRIRLHRNVMGKYYDVSSQDVIRNTSSRDHAVEVCGPEKVIFSDGTTYEVGCHTYSVGPHSTKKGLRESMSTGYLERTGYHISKKSHVTSIDHHPIKS